MKTFLGHDRPIITAMLKSDNIKDIIAEIERTKKEGAEAFGFQIETLHSQYRTKQNFSDIFQAMEDKPAYITSYWRTNICQYDQSDDELTEELLMAFECGAKLCDIRGDLFDRCIGELTLNDKAIEKQQELIKHIHNMNGEVLMSSHIFKFIPKEQVLTIARMQQERGADIAKIVTVASNNNELDENFEVTMLLKNKLAIPNLFLCNGTHCYRHRILGPLLGSCMFLAVENRIKAVTQPNISEAKRMLISAGYMV